LNVRLLEIIDLYASQYGWSRNEILENVYFDEFFIQRDIIDKRKRSDYQMLAYISLLPNMEEKPRMDFLNMLEGNNQSSSLMNREIETDFEAIEKAKAQFEQYSKMT
jgi:hypothetical protein